MSDENLEVRPSARPREVFSKEGVVLKVPDDWDLLLPGDAALSRRIKKDGPTWTMIEMKGRKKFSRGIWAPAERIDALEKELREERKDPGYQKKLDAGRQRRAKEQERYAGEFEEAIFAFLDFSNEHRDLAAKLATVIADHAVPVGSGTVARTKRIPIEQRAESAVIAWMRHQTTAYDDMKIPREKGARREVRRMLARRSRDLLDRYRMEVGKAAGVCPLKNALK
jgi:TfoX/Sxy family transcriptional regulator of competence genes